MATIGAYKGVDITGGTDAEVAAQVKNIDTQAITPQSFVSTAPAKASQQPVSTAADGLSETLAATADTYNQDLQKAAETASKGKQSSLESLVQNMLGADGQTTLTAKEYADTGVNTAEADVKDINSQIMSEQRALDKQIRALKENKQGLFGGALEQEIDRVRGESLTRQADLAIIQMARQGKYDSAKQIADRAVAAKLERQAQITDALKLSYQENKELFTKSEQRAFESAQADRERSLQMTAYKEKARFDQVIKQSDPLYRAQLAKATQEIEQGNVTITNPTAGRYTGALNTILASGKFTKDQKASLIAGINQGEDAFTIVKNQAKNLLGQTGDTKLTQYEVAKGQLDAVQSSLDRYYAAGGKTGLLTGNYEQVVNKLGQVDDPKLVEIATEIAAALQVYRNAVSGTAYSVQEGQDIAAIFPGINKSEGLNRAVLAGRAKAFDSTIDETYRSVLGQGYDQLKKAEQAGVQGDMSDREFVESTLNSLGVSYDQALQQAQSGEIVAINKKTGAVEALTPAEYSAKSVQYVRL